MKIATAVSIPTTAHSDTKNENKEDTPKEVDTQEPNLAETSEPKVKKIEIKPDELKQPSTCWTTRLKVIDKCEIGKDEDVYIGMNSDVHSKIDALTLEMEGCEWLGYLVGFEADGNYVIEDIIIPEQTVASASVNVDNPHIVDDNIIGTVHSHHRMGSFHSGTDNEYLVGNYPVCLVYSNTGKYACKVRRQLPCGHYFVKECEVTIEYPEAEDVVAFVKEAKTKFTQRTYGNRDYSRNVYQRDVYQQSNRFCTKCRKWVVYGEGCYDDQKQLFHDECLDTLHTAMWEVPDAYNYGCC